MSVIDSKTANAHQSVQRSRKLGPIDGAHLGVSLRQVSVRPLVRLVDPDMERAIHRLEPILLVLDARRCVHRIGVVALVAALDPEIPLCDMRSVNKTISAAFKLFL